MRLPLLAAFAVVACAPRPEMTYVSIGSDAIQTVRSLANRDHAHFELVDTDGDETILHIDEAELPALSQELHATLDRCGGFMVHDSLADARAMRPERPTLDYTIDRPQAVRAVLPTLAAAHILDTIRELSAMPTRYYQSPTGAEASRWLRDRWRGFSSREDVTVELVDHGYAQRSVVLTIPGSTLADEVVVIGGHLDSISMRGRAAAAPGADDDASGISTLDEVVRALLAADYRPARTLKVIAYAAEEVGLRGSLAIVRDFERRGIRVVGALQLDMTNYQGSDRDIWLISDYTSPAQNAFLGRLIDTYVGASWGTDRCGYACSDHASWNRAGVPASMPFEARSRDRNHKIHTAADTLELSGNNADHAIKFARLAAAYAIELAKGDLGDHATATVIAAAPHGHARLWFLAGAIVLAGFGARALRARRARR
jgi:leucyl aminopeptidase